MSLNRRDFLKITGTAAGAIAIGTLGSCTNTNQTAETDPVSRLSSMTGDVAPITLQEREQRIEKARRLMKENDIDALFLDSGSSMFYYTGVCWGQSERMMAAVIPANGDIAYICPGFEEDDSVN